MKTFKRLTGFIKPFRKNLAAAIICAFLGILSSLAVPVLIGRAVDCILGAGQVDFKRLYILCLVLAGAVAFSAIFQHIMNYNSNKLSYLTVESLRERAYKKLNSLPLSKVDSTPHGDLANTVINDIDIVGTGLLQGFTQVFSGIVTILGTLVFMFILNPVLGALVVILTPLSLAVSAVIARLSHEKYTVQAKLRGEISGYASEAVLNGALVKAYNMESTVEESFEKMNTELQKVGVKAHFYSALSNPCTRFVNAAVYAAVAVAGAIMCCKGYLSVGGLTSFLSYCSQYTKPFNEISGVVAEFQNALSGAKRVFDLLDMPEEADNDGESSLTVDSGDVCAESVYFSYKPEKPLIRDFSVAVKSGSTIALVGPTGCGKTTIINLLMRFYDINSGKITVDGQDISKVSRQSLRRSFGMVLQDTWLFEGTVKENIAYSRPDASEEEIREAAKKARADGFIKRLPQGYNTVLTAGGENISEGQRQLLSLARVMLQKPPMLILDEATSSIDTRTELHIQRAFAELMQGRTGFIVAHRLSTIKNADLILYMRDGEIIERGTHNQLLNQKGEYYKLYHSQFAPKA